MDFTNSWPNSVHLCLYTLLIILSSLLLPSSSVTTNVSCIPDQSSSLLQLKRGFFHSDLTSWQHGTDCCHGWEGVSCDKATGHVTALDISNRNIQGNINAAIFNLTSLQHLNLAYNDLEGLFPNEIFHITTLIKLDLSANGDLFGTLPNFPTVSSLESLVLDHTNFFGSIPDSIGNLRNLSELSLSNCNFSGQIPSSIKKLGKLSRLDLSFNSHSGSIPQSLFSFPSLEILELGNNKLSGQFRLKKAFLFSPLIELDLAENQLSGPIPWQIFKLSNLETLYLSSNQFSGPIPNSIVWLSSLRALDLSSNNFNGTFDLNLLRHLSNLTDLFLSDNQIYVEDVSDEQLPLAFPQIRYFGLASCNLSEIPRLLRYVGDFGYVDLSKNQLHGVIPRWIWKNFMYSDAQLNLSHNMFTSVEDVPPCSSHSCLPFLTIDFSFNKLKGVVPLVGAEILDYSNNEFSKIPSNYTLYLDKTGYLILSRNMLTGEIPSSLCEPSLIVLDLSYNNLSGSIPACTIGRPDMQILSLRGNKFSGILSHRISRSCALIILDLNSNNLEGYMPGSLTRCQNLTLLDIGNNHIGGTFPFSLGNLPNLQVIVLRSNRFYGTLDLPSNFGKMNSPFQLLRIIDLASNNFNGSLPPLWFSNFKSMKNLSSDVALDKDLGGLPFLLPFFYNGFSATISDKGAQMTLENNLPNLMILIDLSINRFTGDIPETITELKDIKALNLSHNAFTGSIPHQLERLTQIESLDLSWNQLSGEIPQELISLTFLSILNLSFNNLVGRIPQSSQFLAFDNSSFEGNPGLCGVPLSKLCNVPSPGNNSISSSTGPTKKMTAIVLLFLFIGLGFSTGFAMAIISTLIKITINARGNH